MLSNIIRFNSKLWNENNKNFLLILIYEYLNMYRENITYTIYIYTVYTAYTRYIYKDYYGLYIFFENINICNSFCMLISLSCY